MFLSYSSFPTLSIERFLGGRCYSSMIVEVVEVEVEVELLKLKLKLRLCNGHVLNEKHWSGAEIVGGGVQNSMTT